MNVHVDPVNKVYLKLWQPYLSVMLTRGSLEVVVSTGSHNRRQATRSPEQGTLNDGREHTLRIERLAGRLAFVFVMK